MGGLYGNAAATALEDCPTEARGILSGMLQQGYAFGYLLATVFARGLVNTTSHGWRPLYWFGACPPILIIAFRLCLPETKAFIERSEVRHATGNLTSTFVSEGKVALKRHWILLTYMVLLMAGFNFMSHGSQDLYPTMLQNQYSFSPNAVTVTQVVANLGAMAGGTIIGFCKSLFKRRYKNTGLTGCQSHSRSVDASRSSTSVSLVERCYTPIHLSAASPLLRLPSLSNSVFKAHGMAFC